MKILICHNYYDNRGGEEHVVETDIKLLKANGIEVIEYLKKNKNNLLIFINFFFSLKTYFEIKKIIKKENPDIAHIHNIFPSISPSIYYVLKRKGIPIVQTIHNFRFYCSNGLSLKNGKICNKCEKLSIKNIFNICRKDKKLYDFLLGINIFLIRLFKVFDKVDYFIVPSLFVKNKLINIKIKPEKIVLKRITPLIDLISKKPDYVNKIKYFSFIGRLSEEKGVFDLIKVFSDLKNIKLKILGEGYLKDNLIKFIKSNNIQNIELYGYVDGKLKNEIIRNGIATIIPSHSYETGPIVLIESLAMGIPVIASNLGSINEYIEDGYNGFLFDVNDLNQLKRIICNVSEITKEENEKFYKNCLNSYKKFFNLENNFKIIKNLYSKLKNNKNLYFHNKNK